MDHTELIRDLKKKKELKDIDDNFIKKRIKEYLKDRNLPENKRSKEYKAAFKDLRRILRKIYGVFRVVDEKRDLGFYELMFNKITPKKILDLGCGVDPLYYTKLIKAEFYVSDISEGLIKDLKEYFKKNKIKGKAFIFNLVDDDLDNLPKVDLCLMLRLLESLEYVKRNISKKLLENIKARYIVVSFAKIALGKKIQIRKAGRSWFRRILRELKYRYEVFDYENEIVFLIEK